MIALLSGVRLKYGLRWSGKTPSAKDYVSHILAAGLGVLAAALAAALLIGSSEAEARSDHYYAMQAELMLAKAARDKAEAALVRCLNGNAAFLLEGEFKAVWCDKRATVETL